ncbi:MAG: hypothetical protein JXP34_13785 [Planctomycetes bacterium]|nr:hypothetical protein [Planctomycetota bacterium]
MRTWILRAVVLALVTLTVGCASLPEDSIYRGKHIGRHWDKFISEFHEFHCDIDTVFFGLTCRDC